jgi:hypothetical protein
MTRSLEAAPHQISPDGYSYGLRDNEPKTHRSPFGRSDIDDGVF